VNEIVTGDCHDVLEQYDAETFHACVTDPPYGLAFMGRSWDDFEPREYQQFSEGWARAVKRVLKPGAHLLAFSGNRTHHRAFAGIEDAGFEIRDTITWHYGNGFPKNSNTHLKPATEFVVLARTPFNGTAAGCYKNHDTAYLNIEACRVEGKRPTFNRGGESDRNSLKDTLKGSSRTGEVESGRYPSNVVFGERVAESLDNQVGILKSGATPSSRDGIGSDRVYSSATGEEDLEERVGTDSGGPSRYFYTSKASRSGRTHDGAIENDHPTVKPLDLMEWLVKLVTREQQRVLDPFVGSGTTGLACKRLNREFVGIEQDPEHADLARARCGLPLDDPSRVRDDNTHGLEEF